MSGTSESSPSPDNLYELKRKNRKPDLRLYVPPNGKRQNVIEQSTQDDDFKRPTALNFANDKLLCTKKEKFRSPTRFSETADLFVLNDFQVNASNLSAVIIDEVVRADVPPSTARCHNRDRDVSSQNQNE
uniref:Uncharacterized protein n=1 Tax=Romanomermis culicivorax TaxID=13658 RepID=A0A915JLY9_ROMCU